MRNFVDLELFVRHRVAEIIPAWFGSATRLLLVGRTATACCAMCASSSLFMHGTTQQWVRLASARILCIS